MFLLVIQFSSVTQLCPTLCNPRGCIIHGILQPRILEWVAIPFSRRPSQPTQGLNPALPHCRQLLCHLNHQGSLVEERGCKIIFKGMIKAEEGKYKEPTWEAWGGDLSFEIKEETSSFHRIFIPYSHLICSPSHQERQTPWHVIFPQSIIPFLHSSLPILGRKTVIWN